jgi:hypothetical protein
MMRTGEPIVVYDLATVRFRRSTKGASMQMVAASGEVLAVVDLVALTSNEDGAFACCEHALAAARPRRDGRRMRVALYNPYTAQISYGAGPDCTVFADQAPVALDPGGTVGHLVEDGLLIDGRCVTPHTTTVAATSRSYVENERRERR